MLDPTHFIIAIGASSGGMQEINTFFDNSPLDGVSYVIVQHLSSEFKSRMVELLKRHSKLVVVEATEGDQVKCNHVYLIPNDKVMTIRNRVLRLTNKQALLGPNLTINAFFNSLADDVGNMAIGVILSGLGSDGAEGVDAIKKAGGMVIARNPETTNYSSMPASAIATGKVDFILEPELMPQTIKEYVEHGTELLHQNQQDQQTLQAIIDLIKESTPLDFSNYKETTIIRRIKKRTAFHYFANMQNYFLFLKVTPAEVEALANDFLINVTSFFRDKEAFDFIEKTVLPNIIAKLAPAEELKMWVAGCASGEEAYSLAILAYELLENETTSRIVKIFATDIDSLALVQARNGAYTAQITKHVSEERLNKYFIKDGDQYKVKIEIRKMVIFAQHDLAKNPPYCNIHFISCRNLLIYMSPILQKKIYSILLFGLKANSYLFLGKSESPTPILLNLEVINKTWKVYKNIETKRTLSFDAFALPELLEIKHTKSFFLEEEKSQHPGNFLTEAINEALIDDTHELVVCIDEDYKVIKSYGNTSKFLLQKNFNLNLSELLPPSLYYTFSNLFTTASRQQEKASAYGITMQKDNVLTRVSLSVIPLHRVKGKHGLFIVKFTADKNLDELNADANTVNVDLTTHLDRYTKNLEVEVKELKEKLHSSYELLDASNENMQSFNEELTSANEEMQSTNEEMQSVNEELDTINNNYQQKNRELLDLNDDLNNYFKSNINGQLFINKELLLMKFSPGAVNQINLLETDVGRPLDHLSTNIKFETIIADIKSVLLNGNIITKEIETNNGNWYQVMTMPYIQQLDNQINGAIVTFNDISELKKTQFELNQRNQSLQRINADLDNFVYTASHDLLAPLANIQVGIRVVNEISDVNPEVKILLDLINASIGRFSLLIGDISNIAKLESNMLDAEAIDVVDILENVEWSLADKMKEFGVVINKDINIKHLNFSKKNFRSIVYNLVSNSIKFKSVKKPRITIKTKIEHNQIVLSVEDNGIGISHQDINKVFDIYGRMHYDIEGQGIGLYLTKKIVDAAGGNIIVESKPGLGSKFSIYFKHTPD